MKNLLIFSLLFSVGLANAQTEPLGNVPFNQTYDRTCALVTNGTWNSANANTRLGWQWRRVENQFDVSPEGKTLYLLARKQSKQSFALSMAGLGLALGALPVLASNPGTGNELTPNAGLAMGMSLSGLALSIASVGPQTKATDNFEKALWLRNRDAIAAELSPAAQPQFKQLYEQETMYFDFNGWGNGYVKNNQKYRFGMFGGFAKQEFKGSVQGWDSYKKFQVNQRVGVVTYTLGLASMLGSVFLRSDRNSFSTASFGGLAASLLGGGLIMTANSHLRRAVYFRNRDVVGQRLLWQ